MWSHQKNTVCKTIVFSLFLPQSLCGFMTHLLICMFNKQTHQPHRLYWTWTNRKQIQVLVSAGIETVTTGMWVWCGEQCCLLSCRWYHLHVLCFTSLSLSLYQLPTVYSPLFDAIGAIADECCVCLEKLYHAQGTVPRRGEGGTTL